MRQSIRVKRKLLRRAHLDAERARYLAMPGQPFRIVKDWDHDPTVIWQGTIQDGSLQNDYEVQIRYGPDYPFRRPKVFPVDRSLTGNRHQNPTPWRSQEPGDICIFQDNLDDWIVGITCHEIIDRSKEWFHKHEAGTLADEPAPPEIERYYPVQLRRSKPTIIVARSLTSVHEQTFGRFVWVPMKSGLFAFMAILPDAVNLDDVTHEVFRLARLILPKDSVDSDGLIEGPWYQVNCEPFDPLPLVSSHLISFIAKAGGHEDLTDRSICQDYIESPPRIVGICYPTPFADQHWLIYEFDFRKPPLSKGVVKGFRKQTQHKMILQLNRDRELKIYPTHHLSKESLFRRISEPTLQAMDKATVLLLGCGALGSRVAELLVKAGLGHILLVDNDVLKVGNVCRHVLGLDKLGQNKALALKEHLLQRNPYAEVEVSAKDILRADAWLSKAIQKVDLVVSCIGRDAIETWVNEYAMNFSKPIFFCRTYAHATIGEILLARSGRCCFRCATEYLGQSNCPVPRPPDLEFEEMVKFDSDCGATFIPGSAVDIDFTALHCARLAISFLTEGELPTDYWMIRGRPFAQDENWKIEEELKPPFKVFDYSLEIPSDCQVCGN